MMQLSKTDTLVLKGVALLLLLSHHLFYKNPGLYNDITIIGNHQLVQTVGIVSKVCVSIFVFLSGYGLYIYICIYTNSPTSSIVLSFIGKHCMNIFLFHTFIFSLWFSSFIYGPRNPLIIYMLLLVICFFISVIIEKGKKIVKFNWFQE